MYHPPGSSVWRTIHEITPTLYLCSGNAAANRQSVLEKNIKYIINATIDLPSCPWKEVNEIRVPVNDLPQAQLHPYFDKIADFIENKSSQGYRCLVHCVAGVSRSSTLCIVYLMKYHRMSLRDAHQHVKSRRSIIRPNLGFWRQLVEYEKKVRGSSSVSMVRTSFGVIPDVYEAETRNMIPLFGGGRR